jgi:hypothetical protein
MSLLKKLNLTGTTNGPAQFGISNGDEPGHLSVWGVWSKSETPEVYRVVIKAQSPDRKAPEAARLSLPLRKTPLRNRLKLLKSSNNF